jgi:hypothetical protein
MQKIKMTFLTLLALSACSQEPQPEGKENAAILVERQESASEVEASAAFGLYVHPVLVGQCVQCHSKETGSLPAFAQSDIKKAFKVAQKYLGKTAESSTFYTRLQEKHPSEATALATLEPMEKALRSFIAATEFKASTSTDATSSEAETPFDDLPEGVPESFVLNLSPVLISQCADCHSAGMYPFASEKIELAWTSAIQLVGKDVAGSRFFQRLKTEKHPSAEIADKSLPIVEKALATFFKELTEPLVVSKQEKIDPESVVVEIGFGEAFRTHIRPVLTENCTGCHMHVQGAYPFAGENELLAEKTASLLMGNSLEESRPSCSFSWSSAGPCTVPTPVAIMLSHITRRKSICS